MLPSTPNDHNFHQKQLRRLSSDSTASDVTDPVTQKVDSMRTIIETQKRMLEEQTALISFQTDKIRALTQALEQQAQSLAQQARQIHSLRMHSRNQDLVLSLQAACIVRLTNGQSTT